MRPDKKFVSYTLMDGSISINHLERLKTQVPLSCDTYIDILDNDSVDKQKRVDNELYLCDGLILIDTPRVLQSDWVNYELSVIKKLRKSINTLNPELIDITSNPFNMRHRVFISYHHANDQWAKDRLIELNERFNFFIDESVDTGDISDDWDDQTIRQEIRDNYLRNSTVTVLLVGTETQYRKHIDWEIFSSMFDGKINKRSGIVVIMLPSTYCTSCYAAFANEKESVFPHIKNWTSIDSRTEYEKKYPYMPARIIDNLCKEGVKISVANWDNLTVEKLAILIDNAANNRANNEYDMHRPMRRRNN